MTDTPTVNFMSGWSFDPNFDWNSLLFPSPGVLAPPVEAVPDSDGDGVNDLLDADPFNAAIGERTEPLAPIGIDQNVDWGAINVSAGLGLDGIDLDADADRDGLTVRQEMDLRTRDDNADTDGDGLSDFEEGTGDFSYADTADSDRDGILDGDEQRAGSLAKRFDVDEDGDGFADDRERAVGSSVSLADSDGDGVDDLDEYVDGTDFQDRDTDDDGLEDGDERRLGTRSLSIRAGADQAAINAWDSDGDGLDDAIEVAMGLDPTKVNRDEDGDGFVNGVQLRWEAPATSNTEEAIRQRIEDRAAWLGDRDSYVALEPGTVPTTSDGGANPFGGIGAAALDDTDGDGIVLAQETNIGTRDDTLDTDGDGLTDAEELEIGTNATRFDTDGDGVGDGLEHDLESIGGDYARLSKATEQRQGLTASATGYHTADDQDGDGLSDEEEAKLGTDALQADTDHDGLSDSFEQRYGTSATDDDWDNDGLVDGREYLYGSDAKNADTDGDGWNDHSEVAVGSGIWTADTDGDGLSDYQERYELRSDFLRADSDGDGLSDGDELRAGTDLRDGDTDNDGLSDGFEVNGGWDISVYFDDTREGRASGNYENYVATQRVTSDALVADTDGDGLNDSREYLLRTDARDADTDHDEWDDGAEVRSGTEAHVHQTDGEQFLSELAEVGRWTINLAGDLVFVASGGAVTWEVGEGWESFSFKAGIPFGIAAAGIEMEFGPDGTYIGGYVRVGVAGNGVEVDAGVRLTSDGARFEADLEARGSIPGVGSGSAEANITVGPDGDVAGGGSTTISVGTGPFKAQGGVAVSADEDGDVDASFNISAGAKGDEGGVSLGVTYRDGANGEKVSVSADASAGTSDVRGTIGLRADEDGVDSARIGAEGSYRGPGGRKADVGAGVIVNEDGTVDGGFVKGTVSEYVDPNTVARVGGEFEGSSDGLHGSATVGLRREDVQDTDASLKVGDRGVVAKVSQTETSKAGTTEQASIEISVRDGVLGAKAEGTSAAALANLAGGVGDLAGTAAGLLGSDGDDVGAGPGDAANALDAADGAAQRHDDPVMPVSRRDPAEVSPSGTGTGTGTATASPTSELGEAFVAGAVDGFQREHPDASAEEVEAYRAEVASFAEQMASEFGASTYADAARAGYMAGTAGGWDAAHPDATDEERDARELHGYGEEASGAGYSNDRTPELEAALAALHAHARDAGMSAEAADVFVRDVDRALTSAEVRDHVESSGISAAAEDRLAALQAIRDRAEEQGIDPEVAQEMVRTLDGMLTTEGLVSLGKSSWPDPATVPEAPASGPEVMGAPAEDGSRVLHTKYGDFLVYPDGSVPDRAERAKEAAFGSESDTPLEWAADDFRRSVGEAVEFMRSEDMPRGEYLGPTDPDRSGADEAVAEPVAGAPGRPPFAVASGGADTMASAPLDQAGAFVAGAVDGFERSNPEASSAEVEAYRAEVASYADGLLHDTDTHTAVGAARSGFQFGTQAGWDAAHPEASDDERAARESIDLGAVADSAGYPAAGHLTESTMVRYDVDAPETALYGDASAAGYRQQHPDASDEQVEAHRQAAIDTFVSRSWPSTLAPEDTERAGFSAGWRAGVTETDPEADVDGAWRTDGRDAADAAGYTGEERRHALVDGAVAGFVDQHPDATPEEIEAYRSSIADRAIRWMAPDDMTADDAARQGFRLGSQSGWDAENPDADQSQRDAASIDGWRRAADDAGYVVEARGAGLGTDLADADAAAFTDRVPDLPPAAPVDARGAFGDVPADPGGRYVPRVGYAPGWGPDSVVDSEGQFVSTAAAPGVVLSPESGSMTHAQWLGAHLSPAEQSALWSGASGEDVRGDLSGQPQDANLPTADLPPGVASASRPAPVVTTAAPSDTDRRAAALATIRQAEIDQGNGANADAVASAAADGASTEDLEREAAGITEFLANERAAAAMSGGVGADDGTDEGSDDDGGSENDDPADAIAPVTPAPEPAPVVALSSGGLLDADASVFDDALEAGLAAGVTAPAESADLPLPVPEAAVSVDASGAPVTAVAVEPVEVMPILPAEPEPMDPAGQIDADVLVAEEHPLDDLIPESETGTGTTGELDPFGEFDLLEDVLDDPTG